MKETKRLLAVWHYKKHLEGMHLTQDDVIESFVAGFDLAGKRIRDSYNKYNSWLHEEQILKPGKRLNLEKIKELEIKVQTLQELL